MVLRRLEGADRAELAELAQRIRGGRGDLADLTGLAPHELEGVYARACAWLRADLVDRAVRALKALALLRPSENRYLRTLALGYQRQGRLSQAVLALDLVLRRDPEDSIARLVRAECVIAQSGAQEGLDDLSDALLAAQDNDDATVKPFVERAARIGHFLGVGRNEVRSGGVQRA